MGDPYVVCLIGDKELFRTDTKHNATDPVWNFKWDGRVDCRKGPLQFKVFDKDTFSSDDFIGKCSVPLVTGLGDFCLEPLPPVLLRKTPQKPNGTKESVLK